MTDVQIDAGPETDLAVAEAVFHDGCFTASIRAGHCWIRSETVGPKPFSPSHNWNDAMLAAERFGLFDRPRYCMLAKSAPDWDVIEHSFGELELVASAPTGPLAICRAILSLSAVSPSQVSNK